MSKYQGISRLGGSRSRIRNRLCAYIFSRPDFWSCPVQTHAVHPHRRAQGDRDCLVINDRSRNCQLRKTNMGGLGAGRRESTRAGANLQARFDWVGARPGRPTSRRRRLPVNSLSWRRARRGAGRAGAPPCRRAGRAPSIHSSHAGQGTPRDKPAASPIIEGSWPSTSPRP